MSNKHISDSSQKNKDTIIHYDIVEMKNAQRAESPWAIQSNLMGYAVTINQSINQFYSV
jgi:hypothetical protein